MNSAISQPGSALHWMSPQAEERKGWGQDAFLRRVLSKAAPTAVHEPLDLATQCSIYYIYIYMCIYKASSHRSLMLGALEAQAELGSAPAGDKSFGFRFGARPMASEMMGLAEASMFPPPMNRRRPPPRTVTYKKTGSPKITCDNMTWGYLYRPDGFGLG